MNSKHVASAVLLLGLGSAVAATPVENNGQAPALVGEQALRVVKDADTGLLRAPTPEEARAMSPRTSSARSAKPSEQAAQVHTDANGMSSMMLPEELYMSVQATRTESGALVQTESQLGVSSSPATLPTE